MHGFQLSFFLKIQYIPMVFVTYCLIKFKLMFISDICKTLKISMDSIHLDFGVIGAKCYKFTKLKHINSTRLLPSITDARLIMRIHCSEVLFEWEQHHCSICTFCVYFVPSKIGKICKKTLQKKILFFLSSVWYAWPDKRWYVHTPAPTASSAESVSSRPSRWRCPNASCPYAASSAAPRSSTLSRPPWSTLYSGPPGRDVLADSVSQSYYQKQNRKEMCSLRARRAKIHILS